MKTLCQTLLTLGLSLVLIFLSVQQVHSQSIPACGTRDDQLSPELLQLMQNLGQDTSRFRARIAASPRLEALVAIDVDYAFYMAARQNTDLIKRHVYTLIDRTSEIFEREMNIQLTISDIHIWTTPDPYNDQSFSFHLSQMTNWWYNNKGNVRRNFVMGLTTNKDPDAGGIAWLGGNQLSDACMVGYLNPEFISDWDVNVSAHEAGHVFGSPHTHSCQWPGGPIDQCAQIEGDCAPDSPIRTQVGTIMSYCGSLHTFHPFCQQLMRRVAEQTGLPSTTQIPGVPTWNSQELVGITPDFTMAWGSPPLATSYRLQIASDPTFTTLLVDTTIRKPSWLPSGNLNPNTPYAARVRASNEFGSSAWSQAVSITFRADSQPAPVIKFPANYVTNHNGPVEWYPVSGATSYKIEFYWGNSLAETLYTPNTRIQPQQIKNCRPCQINWRVKALWPGQGTTLEGEWSRFASYIQSPHVSVNLSASTANRLYQMSVPITWYESSRRPAQMRIQVSLEGSFSKLLFDTLVTYHTINEDFESARTVMLRNLHPNTSYHVRLKFTQLTPKFEGEWIQQSFRTGSDQRRWTYFNGTYPGFSSGNIQDWAHAGGDTTWVATSRGLYLTVDGKNWTYARDLFTSNLLTGPTTAVSTAAGGVIWVATEKHLIRIQGNQVTKIRKANFVGFITQLLPDGNKGVFAAATDGIVRYDGTSWKLYPNTQQARRMTLDRKGKLWAIIQENSVARFDGTNWELFNGPDKNFPAQTTTNQTLLTYLAVDSSTIWLCSNAWIARLMPDEKWQIVHRGFSSPEAPGNFLKIAFDATNKLFIQNSTGYYTDLYYETDTGLRGLGEYYLGNPGSGFKMTLDRHGRVWLGGNSSALDVYDPRTLRLAPMPKRSFCQGEPITLSYTPNFQLLPQTSFRVEISDAQGNRFYPIASAVRDGKATLMLPDTLSPGTSYRFRIVAGDVYGDMSEPITVGIRPQVSLTPTGKATFCSNQPLTLQSTLSSGATPQWYRDTTALSNATGTTYLPLQSGVYSVVATSPQGCVVRSGTIEVTRLEAIEAVVTPQGDTRVYAPSTVPLSATAGSGYTYEWLNNNSPIAGATSVQYMAGTSGLYAVRITQPNSCVSVSAGVQITIEIPLSVDPLEEGPIVLPNPVASVCRIQFTDRPSGPVSLSLSSISGHTITTRKLTLNATSTELDLQSLAPGAYLLTVEVSGKRWVRMLIKP